MLCTWVEKVMLWEGDSHCLLHSLAGPVIDAVAASQILHGLLPRTNFPSRDSQSSCYHSLYQAQSTLSAYLSLVHQGTRLDEFAL